MARKPIPGQDDGVWGAVLNEFLDVAHTSGGQIRDESITEQQLATAVQSKLNAPTIANGSVTTAKIADGAVTDAKIATGIAQSKVLNLASDLAGKAAASHTHAIADVSGLQAEVDGKANVMHLHSLDQLSNVNVAGATDGQALVLQGSQWGAATISSGGGGGVTDHGALTGLADDDHPQYHNNARGDARYYTKTQVDTSLSGKANTTHAHTIGDVTNLQTTLDAKAATASLAAVATSGNYTDLSGRPTIPAQFNPIAGTNVTLTGTYPNVTISAAGGGGGATNLGATRTGTAVTVTSSTGTSATLAAVDTTNAGVMTAADKTKLNGIATSATANSTDAVLLNRNNHTGTQAISTVISLQAELDTREVIVRWNAGTSSWGTRPAAAAFGVLFLSTNDPAATPPPLANLQVGDVWRRHPDAS